MVTQNEEKMVTGHATPSAEWDIHRGIYQQGHVHMTEKVRDAAQSYTAQFSTVRRLTDHGRIPINLL